MSSNAAPTPETASVAVTQRPGLGQKRMTLGDLFKSQRPELMKVLPKGMDPDRLFRMALTECVRDPKLLECTAESWVIAIYKCAQQGLFPDSGLGYMYLVPRNVSKKQGNDRVKVMEVSAMRGYAGDIRLARNSGEIARIFAEVVYTKDVYKVKKGLDPDIQHEPYDGDDDPGPLKACYAVARLTSGEDVFVTLRKADVLRHMASSDGADSDYSPWKKHPAAMWKKTAIHELFKWLPKDTERMEAAAREIGGASAAVDVTPVLSASVPMQPLTGLEGVTARLAEAPPTEPDGEEPKGCKHPAVPPSRLAGGKTIVCPDCAEELRDPDAPERTPGEDDGPAPESDPKAAVEAIAGAAQTKGRQGRLA